MGVHLIESYVQRNIKDGIVTVNLKKEIEDFRRRHCSNNDDLKPTKPILIFDVMSLNLLLFEKFTKDLLFGGRHWILTRYLDHLFSELVALDVELVFFLDGFVSDSKYETWLKRQSLRYKNHIKILDYVYSGIASPDLIIKKFKNALYSNITLNVIENSCKKFGRLHYAVSYECDREIASYANEKKAFAIFSNDSDFLIFPGSWRYFSTKDIDIETLSTKSFSRRTFRHYFNLDFIQLAIFASIVGNDFVRFETLKDFHSRMTTAGNNSMIFLNIAKFIKESCRKFNFKNISLAIKFFSRIAFDKVDVQKEKKLARSIAFYQADTNKLRVNNKNQHLNNLHNEQIFTHNVLNGNTVHFTLVLFDLRYNDLGYYYDLAIPMYQRQAGALLMMNSMTTRKIPFCGKQSHDKEYMRFNVDPIFPPFLNLPSIEEMYSDDPKFDEIRYKLLKWITDWDKFEHFNIAMLPENYLIDIVTIIFMRQQRIITWKESDLLIWTIKNVNRNLIPKLIEYPDVIDPRAFRIVFLYGRMYANVARTFEICGLSRIYGKPYNFDGVFFHLEYLRFKDKMFDTFELLDEL